MNYSKPRRIITQFVLDKNTGEVKPVDFKEEFKTKRIRGGFRMVYKEYDKAISEIISSKKDYDIVIYIRDKFTYNKIEVYLSSTDISKAMNVSKSKVDLLIKKMKENYLLLKISRGVYRLNPFMYIPYRSDAESLQKEWNELI